jgi:hypothetical protein
MVWVTWSGVTWTGSHRMGHMERGNMERGHMDWVTWNGAALAEHCMERVARSGVSWRGVTMEHHNMDWVTWRGVTCARSQEAVTHGVDWVT